MSHVEHVLLAVMSSADWRATKADQYPDDKRNAVSSRSLIKLGKNLGALPHDDEYVVAYEAAMDRLLEGVEEVPDRLFETETKLISRYGFDYPLDGDPLVFLRELTESVQRLVDAADEDAAEAEEAARYEAAEEAADEAAKEAAHEVAHEVAEEVAKEAADEAYKEAYNDAYKEAYDDAYKEALVEALAK